MCVCVCVGLHMSNRIVEEDKERQCLCEREWIVVCEWWCVCVCVDSTVMYVGQREFVREKKHMYECEIQYYCVWEREWIIVHERKGESTE